MYSLDQFSFYPSYNFSSFTIFNLSNYKNLQQFSSSFSLICPILSKSPFDKHNKWILYSCLMFLIVGMKNIASSSGWANTNRIFFLLQGSMGLETYLYFCTHRMRTITKKLLIIKPYLVVKSNPSEKSK